MDNSKNELLGRVVARYKTIGKFAESLNWSYSKTYRVVTGKQIADARDINQMIRALGISDDGEAIALFISHPVHETCNSSLA